MEHKDLVKKALFIRRFEERLLSLFSQGELHGTIHTCIGQEWTGVAASSAARKGDSFFSNHRCHGHFLSWTGEVVGLLAEIMGKEQGVCGGLGGSQHVHAPGFYANGVQGGMVPVSAGRALAEKMDRTGNICLVFIGDGTLGQGIVYESLNIASKWEIPLLIVVENNHIAQSTPQERTLSGTVAARAKAFDIGYRLSNTWEWERLLGDFRFAVDYVRERSRPFLLEIYTYRLKPHSKGDDTRDPIEISRYEKIDPLNKIVREEPEEAAELVRDIDYELDCAVEEARRSGQKKLDQNRSTVMHRITWEGWPLESRRVVDLIYEALRDNFKRDPRVFMIGEDIEAPYGGAFKVSKDLSELFPGRVRNTPISEGAIIGVGTGLALGGYKPVVEIMFGDFITLGFDQIVNHACKLQFMYNDQVKVPLIVRTPMGGKRGYGPTHSQSLEKHFLGVPFLDILALNIRISPVKVYNELFEEVASPTLVIENKVLYTKFLHTHSIAGYEVLYSNETYPTVRICPSGRDPQVTIFCYGGVLQDVEKAIEIAFDEFDIICEVICPTRIQPLDIRPVMESVNRTRALVTVEEGSSLAALGSEVVSTLIEHNVKIDRVKRVGCTSFIPCSRELEKSVIPGPWEVVSALREISYAAV